MLHWKHRLAVLLFSVAIVAAIGGGFFSANGFYW